MLASIIHGRKSSGSIMAWKLASHSRVVTMRVRHMRLARRAVSAISHKEPLGPLLCNARVVSSFTKNMCSVLIWIFLCWSVVPASMPLVLFLVHKVKAAPVVCHYLRLVLGFRIKQSSTYIGSCIQCFWWTFPWISMALNDIGLQQCWASW